MSGKLHFHAPDHRLRSDVPPLEKWGSKIGREQRPLLRVLDSDPVSLRQLRDQIGSMHPRNAVNSALAPGVREPSCPSVATISTRNPQATAPSTIVCLAVLWLTILRLSLRNAPRPAGVIRRTVRQAARIPASEKAAGCEPHHNFMEQAMLPEAEYSNQTKTVQLPRQREEVPASFRIPCAVCCIGQDI